MTHCRQEFNFQPRIRGKEGQRALCSLYIVRFCAPTLDDERCNAARNGGWLSRRLRWKESRIPPWNKTGGNTRTHDCQCEFEGRRVVPSHFLWRVASSRCEGIREIKNNERALLLRDSFVYIKIDGERARVFPHLGREKKKKKYKKLGGFYMIAVLFVTVSIMEKGCFSSLPFLPLLSSRFYLFLFIPFIFRSSTLILTFLSTREENLPNNQLLIDL